MSTLGLMTYRNPLIATGEYYHVFNRSVASQPIFLRKNDYERALSVVEFYNYTRPGLRFSFYHRLTPEGKKHFLDNLKSTHKRENQILAYCLMPNHVHFLLYEKEDGGIKRLMSNFQNSYAKYFNTKYKRTGSLFQAMFKAVRIENDEQLLHVSRYIHLNPLTSYLVRKPSELKDYLWSSYPDYLEERESDVVTTEVVLSFFSPTGSYAKFVLNQADYQRELKKIRHLTFE